MLIQIVISDDDDDVEGDVSSIDGEEEDSLNSSLALSDFSLNSDG